MALQKKTVSFPILQGSDEKSSLPYSEPGSIQDSDQTSYQKTGEVVKRKGFDNFRNSSSTVGDSPIPLLAPDTKAGQRLYKFRDSLALADGQMLYTKVGNGNMKAIDRLLNCTYKNQPTYTPSNKKVGRVNLIRRTINSIEYDIFSWVQTAPARAASNDTFQVMMAVKEVASGTFFRDPVEIMSFNRAVSSSNFIDEISTMPSVHMVESNVGKIYVVTSWTNTTFSNHEVRCQEFNFSSGIPVLTGATSVNLANTVGTSLAVHPGVPSISVDVNTDKTHMYVLIYDPAPGLAVTVTNAVILYRYEFSSFATPWNASNLIDVTQISGVATSTDVNISQTIGFGGGGFISPVVRYSDPGNDIESSGYPIMVAFTRIVSGTSGATSRYEIAYRFVEADLGGFASTVPLTDGTLKDKLLLNGTQSYKAPTSADVFFTAVSRKYGTIFDKDGGSSVAFTDTGSSFYYGVKALTGGSSHSGTKKEGLLTIEPVTAGAIVSDSGSNLVLYVKHPGGSAIPTVTVVEPGAGFNSKDTANVNSEIETFLGMGGSPSFTLEFDEDSDLIRTKDHEILYDSVTRASAGTFNSICKNASLISDSIREFVSNSTEANATGNGAETYVNISRTNGNTGSFNSCNFLIDTSGKIVATGVPTQSSLNVTSDFESVYKNIFRMFDGVSKVTAVNKPADGQADKYIFGSNILISDGNTYTDATDSELASEIGSDQFYSVSTTELNLKPARALPAVDIGSELLIGGGSLFSFDGVSLVENGFYEYPEVRTLEPIPTNFGSLLVASKSYSYSFVYEYIDSSNNIQESVTTPIQQVTTTTDKTAIIARVYACDISLKRGSIKVTMYRTTSDGDGTLLKKVKTAVLTESQKDFTFFDFGESEADFSAAPVIYTTGGVLDNYQPGSVTDIVEHRGRVVLATPTEFVRFSKPIQQGFSTGYPLPAFVIDVPGDSANITAVESGMNFLAIFTRDAVFAVAGDGPNAIGQGAFAQPTLVANGQGAIPGSAHLSHAFGVFYQADRGIYLLTPNAQVQYVGAAVEDTVGTKTIKSIDVFDHNNEIRFLLQPDSGNSVVCCFNTFYKLWSVWQLHETIVDQINYSATGGSADNTHYILSNASPIRRQSLTNYRDDITGLNAGVNIYIIYSMAVTFKPISINAIQGTQRVYRAMVLYTDKDANLPELEVFVALDYADISSGDEYALTTIPAAPNNVRIHLSKQKCRAVQIKVNENARTVNSSGITLNGLALEIGARPDTFKLPKAQTIAPV